MKLGQDCSPSPLGKTCHKENNANGMPLLAAGMISRVASLAMYEYYEKVALGNEGFRSTLETSQNARGDKCEAILHKRSSVDQVYTISADLRSWRRLARRFSKRPVRS
jgi:hypothetical protein